MGNTSYRHLGIYSDWATEAQRQHPLYPLAAPGHETQQRLLEVLGFNRQPELPLEVRLDDRWEKDGLVGEAISWWVGYGPRTEAWFFKPAGAKEPLPVVLALHDHGGYKVCGKEKIAEGKAPLTPEMVAWHARAYGGRAWVNALAKEGFAVLVHDTFLWGSRKFPLETIQSALYYVEDPSAAATDPILYYNTLAGHHEHLVEKYCNLLGTTLAGVVSHEDRIALNYLLARPDVDAARAACLGLSGGGNRACLLTATSDQLSAAGVVGLMSTYADLLDRHIHHTWMFFPHGWSRYGDWPDVPACRAPRPLLVQYDLEDELFTVDGMRNAHARLQLHYRNAGHPEAYTGQFYPGPHKFDQEMQNAAFAWLKHVLLTS